jgi:8-hydroxy-5-deazaflavin:NADPH oxidoreductase
VKIAIVGAGNMGTGYGQLWAPAGHHITYTYSRSEDKLRAAAETTGHQATHHTDPRVAADGADAVVLCINWAQLDDALDKLGPLPGQLVVDAFTPLKPDMSGLEIGHTTSGAETLAARLPEARVVMAFQNTFADILHAPTRQVGGHTPTMFFCGDDTDAKKTVADLVIDAGYHPIDAGPLPIARLLEPVCFFTVALAYQRGLGSRIALTLLTN